MENFKFFSNKNCEYYPCHNAEELNCLFCFCPLYKCDCGGNFTLLKDGTKDCSKCLLPHSKEGYNYIVRKLGEMEK